MRGTLLILAVAVTAAAHCQDYRRATPRRQARARMETRAALPASDTVFAPDSVTAAGFEKPLRAVRESMFITNSTGRPVESLSIEITYLDMQGRQLHKVSHEVSTDIPPGETRRVEVPSFDRQGLFYYHLSPLPARATRATPFRADVKVRYICHPKETPIIHKPTTE